MFNKMDYFCSKFQLSFSSFLLYNDASGIIVEYSTIGPTMPGYYLADGYHQVELETAPDTEGNLHKVYCLTFYEEGDESWPARLGDVPDTKDDIITVMESKGFKLYK